MHIAACTAPDLRACLCKLVPDSICYSIRLAADDPAMGAPVEYIDLRGTTRDTPATCKYTGNKYYSEVWSSVHKSVPYGNGQARYPIVSNLRWVLMMLLLSLQDWMYPGKLAH